MVTDADAQRAGYKDREQLKEEALIAFHLSTLPSTRHYAGTILWLMDEMPEIGSWECLESL